MQGKAAKQQRKAHRRLRRLAAASRSIPHICTNKKPHLSAKTNVVFLNDVFRCAERDVPDGVMFACERGWNTSHHFAAAPQNTTMAQAITSLCRRHNSTLHFDVSLHTMSEQQHDKSLHDLTEKMGYGDKR